MGNLGYKLIFLISLQIVSLTCLDIEFGECPTYLIPTHILKESTAGRWYQIATFNPSFGDRLRPCVYVDIDLNKNFLGKINMHIQNNQAPLKILNF